MAEEKLRKQTLEVDYLAPLVFVLLLMAILMDL